TISCLAQQSPQVLRNHVPSAVSNGEARLTGSLPATQKLHVTISLPLRNQAALDGLLKRLYDPSNPDYRHFLSGAEFTEQFAPTPEDYQAVVDFATAHGLAVTDQRKGRLIVPLDGTVRQIEDAFNVRMNVYQHPTENRTFYSTDREPSLVLSVPVAHITGLDNFSLPRPASRRASANEAQQVPAAGSGPGGQYLASDMRTAYYGGTTLTGVGQVVALVEFDGYDISDVNLSFSSVGQSYSVPVQNILLDGATGAKCQFITSCLLGDSEEVLDIVQAIGMAPGLSQVRVYIGNSDVDIFNRIAYENIAKQVSISWVWGNNASADDYIFRQMAAQGQTIFAASGDWGVYPVIEGAFPAEDANVTAVGGTTLYTNGVGGPWLSELAWSGSGGGPSPDGIPIPPYQSGLSGANGASTSLRNVPDVSAEADYDNWVCFLGGCQTGWGGTSFAAPRWAAFLALVNQQVVASGNPYGLGNINDYIYRIAQSSRYSNDFHDVSNGPGNGGYFPGLGYDLVTGLGSPTGQNLINDLVEQGTAYRPTTYFCLNDYEPDKWGWELPSNPAGPTTGSTVEMNSAVQYTYEASGQYYVSELSGYCTWSAFPSHVDSNNLTLYVPYSANSTNGGYLEGFPSLMVAATIGSAQTTLYSGTAPSSSGQFRMTIPAGTDLSTIQVTIEYDAPQDDDTWNPLDYAQSSTEDFDIYVK
ncbi:MAG: S53 family peptidase, partial [Terracidiphilus sp.]